MPSNNSSISLVDIYNSYKSWVSKNPQSLGDWENAAKWVSYFLAGRINNSHVVSELIYCLSNLLVLFNDTVIKKSRHIDFSNTAQKVKLWLTVVEYSEVFCELSAKKLWGDAGKWLVIVSIQVFKCIARLVLVYLFKQPIIQSPAVPVLDRKNIKINSSSDSDISQFESVSFTLKRSGRVVRKVDTSPPLSLRSWKPVQNEPSFKCENNQILEKEAEPNFRIAETIYITKPIVHLASMAYFGTDTWKQWMISLAMDLTSLQMYRHNREKLKLLTPEHRIQLSRRTVVLLLYLIKSPVYEKYSKDRSNAFLLALSNHLPLVGLICTPLAQYLPFWQNTYFYMWST